MQTQNPTQIRSLLEHLESAAAFDDDVLRALRALALQLSGKEVLPLIGAGASFDCGMCLAKTLGKELRDAYLDNPRFAPHVTDVQPDLGVVAEEIYGAPNGGQKAVVEALGFPDDALWPPASAIAEHFCAYRVLARLTREGMFDNAVSLNYDCGYEAGLHGEGFLLAPDVRPGRVFSDHVTVMADQRGATAVDDKGSFLLRKIHGCAERYRSEEARDPSSAPEDAIIVRQSQLKHWDGRDWALRHLQNAARQSVLLLIGFSASDANIVGELTTQLSADLRAGGATDDPRVLVINHSPLTNELRFLTRDGRGNAQLGPGKVDHVVTGGGTTTAALLVLLCELLADRLDHAFRSNGYALPDDREARLATLVLAAPFMLRWAFLLRHHREADEFMQRANLFDVAERGYVPLQEASTITAHALRRREELRATLGLTGPESARDLIANHGFVVDGANGTAYLPTGLDDSRLRGACRTAGPLKDFRRVLPSPRMTCIVVGNGNRGFNLDSGKEVSVP